ncbi:MAG: small-conductance mechanosensitive channel [Acidimicrobiales bacterium]
MGNVETLTLVASIRTIDDLTFWFRGSGLEVVMLLTGGLLTVRAAKWLLSTGERAANENSGDADPLGPRHHKAIAQAMSWLVTAMVFVAVGVLIADRFGLPLATLVPTATVIGVAVGFGAQRLMQDLFSGFFLLAERQLAVGDEVRISPPGTTEGVGGTVEEITLRVTRLRTIKGEVVFIPNGEIRQVTNLSVEWARLVLDVPLRPDEDVNRAITVLREVCEQMWQEKPWDTTLLESPAVLGVQAINVGVVQVRIVARVRATEQWEAGRELRRRVALGLSEAGMEPVRPIMTPEGM